MAGTKTPVNVPADDDGWSTVSDESATYVKFEDFGDAFTGIKVRNEVTTGTDGKEYVSYLFRAQGTPGVEDGTLCSVAHSYKLAALADIPEGVLTRITYINDVEVGRPQPMKDYKIQTRN